MRDLIKIVAGLFLAFGTMGVIGYVFFAVSEASEAGGAGALVPGAVSLALGSLVAILFGGIAYMLCQIDSRLEKISAASDRSQSG